MKHYYSPSTGGFYNEGVHGARRIEVADPSWIRPAVTVTIPAGDGKSEHTEEIPDLAAIGPMITIDNPDCKLPADAVEVEDQIYRLLLAGQAAGQVIVPDEKGNPVNADPEPDFPAAARGALSKSDATAIRCAERGVAVPAEWLAYRAALRAIAAGTRAGPLPETPAYPEGT